MLAASLPAQNPNVRPPMAAGSFYPADAKQLAAMIDGLLAATKPTPIKDLAAIVVPHAGYVYSGHVAAQSYALLKGRPIQRVVVIAPCHVDAFSFSSVFDGDAYDTPLGRVAVDTAFAAKLASMDRRIKRSERGHVMVNGRGEHSLEVQLPFLQRVLKDFKVVPIVMGEQDYDTCRALGVALAKLIQGPGTLIVASSDLSHFHPYDKATQLDGKTLQAIEEWDYLSMARNFERRVWEACGGGPIVAAMIASERLGATESRVLKYANSGDVTGDRSSVVGYGAAAFYKPESTGGATSSRRFSLTTAEKAELLEIAKKSVETAVREHKGYDVGTARSARLMQERGAFVTLKKHGQLRGCIGYVAPVEPLAVTVRDVAAFAALRDQRFLPVTAAELPELEYEISVLSPLRRVLDTRGIRIGTDGLVIKRDTSEGLLLPQVAPEQGWNRLQFLENTCLKAGINASSWKDPNTDIFSFTALVFGDHTPARRDD
ncbi:MAG: AmmeMemoRadiSam system protein B [Acidobacteriales bacterium]|nr:AmmeMemoRadiSam system protein B [Terriglobales bacterium]